MGCGFEEGLVGGGRGHRRRWWSAGDSRRGRLSVGRAAAGIGIEGYCRLRVRSSCSVPLGQRLCSDCPCDTVGFEPLLLPQIWARSL